MREFRAYVQTLGKAYLIWDMASVHPNIYTVAIHTIKGGYRVEWKNW